MNYFSVLCVVAAAFFAYKGDIESEVFTAMSAILSLQIYLDEQKNKT